VHPSRGRGWSLFEFDAILFLHNVHMHWRVVVLFPKGRLIEGMDYMQDCSIKSEVPFGDGSMINYDAIGGLQEPMEYKDWTFGCCQDTMSMKKNGWDCGLYAATYNGMMFIALQSSFEGITKEHIHAYHQKVILHMLNGDSQADMLIPLPCWYKNFMSTSTLFLKEHKTSQDMRLVHTSLTSWLVLWM
jgi:hypothetical protein